ncbi:MAG: TauD/TfdA family dioxygenase [Streptosporangiales bacterium]|nr:TauD/TfdA family dioxygenase [Streptosporangiales bacterium]
MSNPYGPFGQPVTAAAPGLAERAREALDAAHAVLVQDFPPDPGQYIAFLRELGTPLENYGAGSSSPAYTLHPNINVVRCTPAAAETARVQEQGGPLPPHSARAFAARRPRYIAMYMANPGWPAPAGQSGESIVVRWSRALQHMAREDPRRYARDYRLLSQTPVTITAAHVADEWATTPIIYPLPGTGSEASVGVRYSLALLGQLPAQHMDDALRDEYRAAVGRLAEAAASPDVQFTYQAKAGDILILDNNRFAHGRLAFPRSRPGQRGNTEVNPRELWSVTVG